MTRTGENSLPKYCSVEEQSARNHRNNGIDLSSCQHQQKDNSFKSLPSQWEAYQACRHVSMLHLSRKASRVRPYALTKKGRSDAGKACLLFMLANAGWISQISVDVGEDTPRSYVKRGHNSILVRRGYTSILCQERTRLDPMSDEWTRLHPCQERVHLNPMSGEDSEHTSILARRGQNTPLPNISGDQSCVGMGENDSSLMAHRRWR